MRKVSGEAAWRTFWPIQTPMKVGTMAATAADQVGGVEDVLLDEGCGQGGGDEHEQDAEALDQLVLRDLQRLHVGQERHGGHAGDAGDGAARDADQRVGPRLAARGMTGRQANRASRA